MKRIHLVTDDGLFDQKIFYRVKIVFYSSFRRENIQRLLTNERGMLPWMCKIKAENDVNLHDLYSLLSLQLLESRLRINRLRWKT